MRMNFPPAPDNTVAERIRVRGAVQGVGFRPTAWRLANAHGLRGWVGNDGQGVVMLVSGAAAAIEAFVGELERQAPPLARIEAIEREAANEMPECADFRIVDSVAGAVATSVVADAATCPDCLAEIADPTNRRFAYPFTNCTHCGPRLSIIEAIPYDRANTTMRDFALCPECGAEYENPADRRFHAQPIACPVCGPRVWVEDAEAPQISSSHRRKPVPSSSASLDSGFRRNDEFDLVLDLPGEHGSIDVAAALIASGHIVAIKSLGGFQLACDAGNEAAVARLRTRKQRECKPFALMARDIDAVRRYCALSDTEAALLQSPAAPIVLLDANGPERVASGVAPGIRTLGFMLPNTPLHHLLLQRLARPIVLTSGNLSDEPQCIDNADARARLGDIADGFLMHDRGIARRVDDSVVRVMAGEARVLRRARGYAPAPLRLPDGFEAAPALLAMGGELKNTFCLLRDGEAILSHHIGDLADALCHADYARSIADYQRLFEHDAHLIAVDRHPEYLSRKLGLDMTAQRGLPCVEVQHHHAHIAACLAENGVAADAPPVLGIALDGLGYGDDGTLWGGEFLLADYRGYRRLGSLKPAAMAGGAQAIYEPWRNAYAQFFAAENRAELLAHHGDLDIVRFLAGKPLALLDGMIAKGINSPLASSAGRLFDAVAAAAGVCRERAWYEGQAAVEFEALIDRAAIDDSVPAYPLAIRLDAMPCIDPAPMWQVLLDDLQRGVPAAEIAARFHLGVAEALGRMAEALASRQRFDTVALSGGVFQNRVLLELAVARFQRSGFKVLTHRRTPANDGGLSLGQAVVAAAQADAGQQGNWRTSCA